MQRAFGPGEQLSTALGPWYLDERDRDKLKTREVIVDLDARLLQSSPHTCVRL